MPGFEVVEARAPKCGIRGTATGKMRFTNMRVPKENILGQIGRGLQAALTVLNYGRVTFGATCTGHAKVCIKAMIEHAKKRVQFQQPLAEFQLVQKKIAFAAAHCFAMEAATAECAAFIDNGSPGLHARNRDSQGLRDRASLDHRQRHAAGLGRKGLLLAINRSSAGCATPASTRSAKARTTC